MLVGFALYLSWSYWIFWIIFFETDTESWAFRPQDIVSVVGHIHFCNIILSPPSSTNGLLFLSTYCPVNVRCFLCSLRNAGWHAASSGVGSRCSVVASMVWGQVRVGVVSCPLTPGPKDSAMLDESPTWVRRCHSPCHQALGLLLGDLV